jgi:hypothetical protein
MQMNGSPGIATKAKSRWMTTVSNPTRVVLPPWRFGIVRRLSFTRIVDRKGLRIF